MKPIIKSFVKKEVNKVLQCICTCKAKNYNIKNTIVITASPRGGSTWLAEILNTLPGYSILWEPLALNEVPEARKIGFHWRTYVPPGTNWREAEGFLRKILTGQFLTRQTTQTCKLSELISAKAWIVKFCRANMFLKWMTERFSTRTPILLIRHPCAVVASQMRHGRWITVSSPRIDPRFIEDYPEFEPILSKLKTWEEALSGIWCLEYFATLSIPKPHPWLLVTYEKLVRDGEAEIDKIFKTLGFETPKAAKEHLRIPSFTTKEGSPILSRGDQLSGWKKYLNKKQIKRILDVVYAFGLDFYTDELEPDYERLMGKQPVQL